jgi:hypothetical protein
MARILMNVSSGGTSQAGSMPIQAFKQRFLEFDLGERSQVRGARINGSWAMLPWSGGAGANSSMNKQHGEALSILPSSAKPI